MPWSKKPTGRSVRCNGEALRTHRGRRGLTQPELATLAGFTTRLIAKAEASETVHPDTIEVLAETLSTETHPVFPEDLVASPKDIARLIVECYARHERQCVAHCSPFLADDLVVVAPGDQSLLPFAGERHSIDGFDDFWGAFFSVMEREHKNVILDEMRIIAEGNEVVVLTKEYTKFCGAYGGESPVPLGFVMEFERGKLKRFEDHFDARTAQGHIRNLVATKATVRERLRKASERA